MIHNRSFVPMNPDKKEINELEHSPFDFIANEGNIHSYAASLIPSHWHRELEIFILLEGRVRIGAGSETFEVRRLLYQHGNSPFLRLPRALPLPLPFLRLRRGDRLRHAGKHF